MKTISLNLNEPNGKIIFEHNFSNTFPKIPGSAAKELSEDCVSMITFKEKQLMSWDNAPFRKPSYVLAQGSCGVEYMTLVEFTDI